MLLLTAAIWGCAFVAQSVGMEYLGPFTFNAIRCLLGAVVLVPVILMVRRDKTEEQKKKENPKLLLIGGLCCGAAFTTATSLQQIGIMQTTAGKAGFITALYIVIVPVLGIFIGKKVGVKVWTGVAVAVVGMYLLCIKEGFTISKGDFLILLCAGVFSVHILMIDYFSPKVDGVCMSCIQFLVCGLVSAVPMMAWEKPTMDAILAAWMPIGYAGVFSCGVAYTLQIIAQKNVAPTVASLLLSLESVFSVLAGWLILGERMTIKEMLGCVLVFAAVILAQLPEKESESLCE